MGNEISDQIKAGEHSAVKSWLNDMIDSIELSSDKMTMTFKPTYITEALGLDIAVEKSVTLIKPMTLKRRGQEMKIIIDGVVPNEDNKNSALIKMVANAYLLKTELESGAVKSIKEFAAKYRLDHGDSKNLVPLGYLAPTIVEDIIEGRQPDELNARNLKNMPHLPIIWTEQRQFLAFN